jgi:hypothetical protein
MVAQTISLSIMLVAILAGILFNNKAVQELKADLKGDIKDFRAAFRRDIDRLDAKIDGVSALLNARLDGVSAGLNARLDVIEGDLRQFYHLSGKLEGRIDGIEKRSK